MSYRCANFMISLRSPATDAVEVAVHASPAGDLAPVLVALPPAIGRLAAGEEPPAAEADLRSLGVDLFESLFPPHVRELYRAALAGQPADAGLRVQVQTDSAHLAAIPWEYSFDSVTGTWLALNPRTPLVRYYALPFARRVGDRKQSLRVLVVLAAPSDLPELDLANERRRLEALFQPLQQAGRLTLHYAERPATVEHLQNMLRAGCDILHYVGHGTQQGGQGALLLEREDGKPHQVLAEEVAILLRGTGVQLVCLNACLTGAERGSLFGGLGPALVQAEIPAVVAMQYAMPDQSALRFTRAFYGAVTDDQPIDAAITAARIALRTQQGSGSPEWGYPVLFMRAADGYLWPDQTAMSTEPAATCPTCGRGVAPTARYCGNCGAALTTEAAPTCPRCGASVRAQKRFCAACGADLRPEPSSRPNGGVQIGGEAKVEGIVAGQDLNLNLSGGNLVIGGSGSATLDHWGGSDPPNPAGGRPSHER